ncbi:MAG: NAD(P)/FAD-dependent oxidoreductase [Bacteroidota bacterium]|nr:NAD(P)/FAD-dependent oxidoreductase [Bacteroidota bacterium]
MTDYKYDTIIVGGGIAGLTAAAYLSEAGRRTLLIEKNSECGGLVNSFSRDGFVFDAGVRALEDAGIIKPMLAELGIKLDVVKSPVSVGIGDDILNIENLGSLDRYSDLLKKIYPASAREIDEIIRVIRRVMKDMDVLYGVENPVFKDLKRDREFLFKKLLPWLPKFLFTVGRINRMDQPVEGYLEKIISDRSLRDIISQHFFRNTPAFFALSYFSLYLDYFYPSGGVGNLAGALEKKILGCGGEIRRETRITSVKAGDQTVTDRDGTVYKYGTLIWAADLKALYRITDTDGLAPQVQKGFAEAKEKMLKHRGGDSVFTLFMEVDEPLESFRKTANGHFFYTPLKEGLGIIHREELDALLAGRGIHDRQTVLEWLDRFTALNTYEISIPGLKDPSLVPEGKTGLIISFLAEYDLFRAVQADGWYDEFVTEIENRVIKVISASVYPWLKEKIMARFSFTPLSIENRIASSEGAITGWSFQDQVPVINHIQVADRSVVTPLPSVFQAGQWAYSPAGVPMSILTGKLAANRVMKHK